MSDKPYIPATLDDAGLSPSAFRVYCRIARRWSPERGCDESASNMAAACRLKRLTVFRALSELEDAKLIKRTERPGQTTRIDIIPVPKGAPGTERGRVPKGTTPRYPKGDGYPVPQRDHKGTPLKESCKAQGSNEPTRARGKPKPKPKKKSEPIPDWISPDTWADWEQHRREKRQPLKPTTVTYQINQLSKFRDNGHDPNAIIERSIANGWTGLFEPDTRRGGSPAHPARGGTTLGSQGGSAGRVHGGKDRLGDGYPGNPGTARTTGSERAGQRGRQYAIDLVQDALGDWVKQDPHIPGNRKPPGSADGG